MRRTTVMTIGFVLIFIGIQLNFVESYVLTPRVSAFLSKQSDRYQQNVQLNGAAIPAATAQNSPYYQASHTNPQIQNFNPIYAAGPTTISPPQLVVLANFISWNGRITSWLRNAKKFVEKYLIS